MPGENQELDSDTSYSSVRPIRYTYKVENRRSQHSKIHLGVHRQTKKYAILEQGIMDSERNKK